MFVRIVLWELDGTPASIESLRAYLRDESVDAFAGVEGLRFKAWVSDPERNQWGAVYLWESRAAARRTLPSRARELIGKDPDSVRELELEATIEGVHATPSLSRLGLAFEG